MRFEWSIRVATTFFAALIGFGLKNILDSSETGGQQAHDLVTQKWPVFIIAVLFFLRFLLGSANHLWLEYVHREEIDDTPVERQNALVALDIGFLTVFGIVAAAMLYANTVEGFLVRAIFFLAFALLWARVADPHIRPWISGDTRSVGNWGWWGRMNAIQGASFLVGWFLIRWEAGRETLWIKTCCESLSLGYLPVAGWSVTLSILALVSAVVLAWDFILQLREVSTNVVPTTSEENASPPSPSSAQGD